MYNNNNQKKEYSEILSLIWKIPNTDECRRIQIISLSAGVKQWSVFIFCSPTYTLHHHFFKLQFFSILFMNVCIYISLCSPLSLLAVCCIQLQIIRQLIGGGELMYPFTNFALAFRFRGRTSEHSLSLSLSLSLSQCPCWMNQKCPKCEFVCRELFIIEYTGSLHVDTKFESWLLQFFKVSVVLDERLLFYCIKWMSVDIWSKLLCNFETFWFWSLQIEQSEELIKCQVWTRQWMVV